MTGDERVIEYVYDNQDRLIEARWFEEANVTVFDYSHLVASDAAPALFLAGDESRRAYASTLAGFGTQP